MFSLKRWLKWDKISKKARSKEQRKDARINDYLDVSLQVANEIFQTICRSKDISEGGMRLRLHQEFKVGTFLKIWIDLQESSSPILVIGRVAWLKEISEEGFSYEIGIEFKMMDHSVRDKLNNHIRNLSKNEY